MQKKIYAIFIPPLFKKHREKKYNKGSAKECTKIVISGDNFMKIWDNSRRCWPSEISQ